LQVGSADGEASGLGGTGNIESLEGLGLSRGVQGKDLDLSGVSGEDVHEVIVADGGDVIVDGRSSVALSVLSNNSGFEVVVDVDLSDFRGSNVGDIEVASFTAEAGPASSALPGNAERRRLASGGTGGNTAGEIEDVYTETGVSGQDRVLALNDGHAEG